MPGEFDELEEQNDEPALDSQEQAAPFEQLDEQATVPAAPPAAPQQLTYRDFVDPRPQRQAIFDRVKAAYAARKLEHQGFRLEFADVDYRKPREFTKRDEKDAVLGRKRLYWALQGRMRLVDPEGKVVREDPKPRTLAQVPYLSQRGTFIHNGNEYVVSNQQRLRAGIYTRRQNNGEVESQFNIIPGTGRGFRVKMDPESGVFRIQVGQSNMKLFPVLKDLGYADKDLEKAWGPEIYRANALADDKEERKTLPKLVAKLGGPNDQGLSPDEARARLGQIFERMRLDPKVTQRTMKHPYERVDRDTLLAATNRVLKVNRFEEDPDQRDDLPYQSFHSAEDFFEEHVNKDAKQLIRQAFWRMKNGRDVPDNYFTKQLQGVLLDSGLGAPLSEINPVEILDARHKINRLGEGGIGSTEAVTRDARGVQPTHFGFIDPIRAPECYDRQTEVMTDQGWVSWPDVTPDTKFACQVDGQLVFAKAQSLYRQRYTGPMYGGRSRFIEYLVTPNHRMYVRSVVGQDYCFCSPADVQPDVHLFDTVLRRTEDAPPFEEGLFDQWVADFDDEVFCASVPGGLLYVRRNNSCGFWCGNSQNIGLDLRIAHGVVRGSDGQLYTQALNPKTGQKEYVSSEQFVDSVVAFPGELEKAQQQLASPENRPFGRQARKAYGKVRAMVGGRIRYVPVDQVQYELPEGANMLTPGTNFVPLASALKGQRLLMGARMQSQALPLREPEAPLVQSKAPGDQRSMNQLFGRDMGAVFADQPGTVKAVTADGVVIKHDDGTTREYDLYNNHPFNQKCVSGDTRLFVRRSDGSFFTGEIKHYRVKDGDATLSVDKQTGTVHWRPVEAVQRLENDKQLLRVRLASGRTLTVTEDHSLVRLGDRGLEKVAPGDLVVGKEYLPLPRLTPVSPKPLPAFAQRLTPLEFGQLVGIYAAEGSRTNDTCHQIACFEAEGAAQILKLVRLLCGGGTWNGSTVYVPTNRGFASWVDDFVGHGAFHKHLHRGAAIYGSDFARGVIGGFFSGDGWAAIDNNGALQVEAGTRSEELRDDLVFFAQLGGLPTTQREVVIEDKPFFYIRVRTEAVAGVPWLLQRKAEASTRGCLSNRSFDAVPLPRSRRKAFYKYAGSAPRIHHMGNRGRVPVCEIAGDPWLKKWSDELVWDRVVAVEEAEHQDYVYDLSAGNGVFWANGVFIHNTSIHNTPLVKPGERINPGQLLARSNFTNDRGELALGRNMRVAFHMMDGMTHEDAVVLSESGAKKYSSEQLYSSTLERNDQVDQIKRSQFVSKYPGIFNKEQLKTIDENGVVLPGTIVRQGDPLILAVGNKRTKVKGSLMRSQKSQFTDASETWEHEQEGQVTDVYKTGKGWRVTVKTYTPTKVGDKLANNYGGKGVVARIVPDSEMPTDESGQPLELALNPMGVISRVNPSQLIESALGKVAAKTGQPYILPSFSDKHLAEFALQELQKHGLKDTETLIDPRTGRKIPGVFTGVQHFYKLHHLAESKLNARSQAGYTMDDTPAKGGKDGCFIGRQRILTINGWERISHLVEKQKRTPVRTWDAESGEWLYRPITDWFTYRAKVDDIRVVEFVGPSLGDDKDWSLQSITATVNHEVYLADGSSKLVGDLVEGDCLATWGVLPTEQQWQLAIGTMLGDASCRTSNGFTVEHSVKQIDYVNWKLRLFGSLGATFHDVDRDPSESSLAQKTRIRSRVVSVASPAFVEALHALCYDESGRKTVTKAWVEQLTELGVCLWLLDDGYLTNTAKKAGQVSLGGGFCTCAFSAEERQMLCDRLSEIYGPHFRVTGDQVQFRKDGARALVESVARYVPAAVIPRSKAVLLRQVSALQKRTPLRGIRLSQPPGLYPARIRSIRPYVHDKPGVSEINVYDITVDQTHKYCASSALVSNSKRIGLMETFGLLSHGATEVLRDAKLIRGQRNDDYWQLYRQGFNPPEPRVSRQYQKFEALLQGSGVRLRKSGNKTQVLPMSDADVQALAADREITSSDTVDFDTGEPIKGGLFDLAKTGGADGTKWSFVRLPEPLPNPIMEEPVKALLGLTGPKYEAILAGQEELGGLTGGAAIKKALEGLDVQREIDQSKDIIRAGRKTKRDKAVKRLGYLTTLQKNEIQPAELMMTRVPVVPPKWRPVSRAEGVELVADANHLYKELLEARDNYDRAGKLFGTPGDTRLDLYNAFKAATGLGQPVTKESQQRGLRGLLKQVLGDSPKFGFFQRSVIGQPVDNVGRAVIVPDPDYDIDEVGLPDEAAWEMFKPFIIRDMVRRGKKATDAVRAFKDRTDDAKDARLRVMQERPLIINRAPSLHKHNLTAHFARPVAGNALRLPIPILAGHGADFDGDALNFHVPVSDKAVKEAKDKMRPSRTLYSAKDFQVHMLPTQGYIMGLYLGTRGDSGRPRRTFRSQKDVLDAYRRGEIDPDDPVTVLEDE